MQKTQRRESTKPETAFQGKNSIVTVMLGESLSEHIHQLPHINKIHDAYQIETETGLAFLFDYAVLVCWGINKTEREKIIKKIQQYISDPSDELTVETYTYHIEYSLPFTIRNDHITISSSDPEVRLALSHALSQSAKLSYFEDSAQQVISSNTQIAKKLRETGKTNMTRKKLSKLRGMLFDTSCDITLHFNLLDKPNFFWDYPELDEFYLKLAQYLEMDQRLNLLNQKLSLIRELLDMLAEEQNHQHSSFLEWIIIILIAIEILLFIFSKH